MNCAWLLLPLLACCSMTDEETGDPAPVPRIDGGRAYEYVKKQVEFGPRPAGSEALRRTRDWFVEELKKLGLKPRIDSFRDERWAKGIEFHNIECEIPGSDPKDDRLLVLGSHYDTKLCKGHDNPANNFEFVGANDGASSSGLLLELARWFKDHPLRCKLLLIWFDGEESLEWNWHDDKSLFGSRHAVKQLRKRFPKDRALYDCVPVMVLLDMVGHKDLSITRDTLSSRRLQDIVLDAAKRIGKEKHFFKNSKQVTDDHLPFANYSIEVIDIIQFGDDVSSWWHTPKDRMNLISAESLEIVGKVTALALPVMVEKFYPPRAPDEGDDSKGDDSKGKDGR